jgi:hypothetical protein
MRFITVASTLAITAMLGMGQAEARGCLKGAVVGGLAGHVVGHGVAGAAAGCAIGHHRASRTVNTNGSAPAKTGATSPATSSRSY